MKKKANTDVLRFVRPNILNLRPYEAKEIPCGVKLDANESPYPEKLSARTLKSIETNRYPDPQAEALRKAYAQKNLPAKIRGIEWLLHGNGSDELIFNLVCVFGGPVIYPVPTFSMYGKIAAALGQRVVEVPLQSGFDIDDSALLSAAKKQKGGIIFLSSPNNPTGNSFSAQKILRVIEESGCVVVVDEAYQPFSARKSFMSCLGKYPNLAILRTLSKVGLAALRVGFLIAEPGLVAQVNKVRLPFNVNSFSQAIAVDSISRASGLRKHIRGIVSERKRLHRELSGIKGVTAYPSDANFILFKVPDPERVYKEALRNGVLIRNLCEAVEGCLRVTVGSGKENEKFIRAIKRTLE
ncbi:MAG: histidinol-phosphate transaminase [Nitrospiraceae bacterium]|nr:histidinol-phosphate transaminase [Nitrospiraceae bacterium]